MCRKHNKPKNLSNEEFNLILNVLLDDPHKPQVRYDNIKKSDLE